ncbi:MAG: mechanosensitive ion channel [Deltaproteobacteria bacterium]|nr:mechanosensitive ion channel [Deltaproteobacteria bacterium]
MHAPAWLALVRWCSNGLCTNARRAHACVHRAHRRKPLARTRLTAVYPAAVATRDATRSRPIDPRRAGSRGRGVGLAARGFVGSTGLALLASVEPPVQIFGIRLVGIHAESGRKLVVSLALVLIVVVGHRVLRGVSDRLLQGRLVRARFWVRQALGLIATLLIVVGLVSLWFDDPTRLTTALGLVTAGLAFALQKVVTAVAGYIVIMRGKTFAVGDRIVMGGVRGDVVDLHFTQTTIMEMGQPPPVQNADPAMWVHSRQYTGRIVTVSNARVFDEPVFNYTREFPYIWEEIAIPVMYSADRDRVERLLLGVAQQHTAAIQDMGDESLSELARRYLVQNTDVAPKVFYRLTDNWLELTIRFVAREHGVRDLKDAMCRDILRGLDEAGIEIASATFQLVGLPKVQVELAPPPGNGGRRPGSDRTSAAPGAGADNAPA